MREEGWPGNTLTDRADDGISLGIAQHQQVGEGPAGCERLGRPTHECCWSHPPDFGLGKLLEHAPLHVRQLLQRQRSVPRRATRAGEAWSERGGQAQRGTLLA